MKKDENIYYAARKKLLREVEALSELAKNIEEVTRRIKKALEQAEKYEDKSKIRSRLVERMMVFIKLSKN